jgi:actin-related protein 5
LSERIYRELRALREVGSIINVFRAKDPILDAWRGASKWTVAQYSEKKANFGSSQITRKLYEVSFSI